MNIQKKSSKFRPKLGGAIYIVPNLLTAGNLFFGYFSIVKSLQGNFVMAAQAIFIATIFDVLDGRVARMTHSTSEFGVQFDSLCDLISFGLAPALLMFQFALSEVGRLGWISCFIFLAFGALRLARFNVQSSIGQSKGDFTGLPIPMAAALVASYIGMIGDFSQSEISGVFFLDAFQELMSGKEFSTFFLLLAAPLSAVLMVSNFAYRSHKSLHLKSIKPFKLLAIFVVIVGLVASSPFLFGWLFFLFYALSGPFEFLLGWKKATNDDDIFHVSKDDEHDV